MIRGKRTLAVIPARGGSKGLPLKNLRPVGGIPMVARAGLVCRDLPWLDRAVVSTDHDGIKRAAEESGLAAPFLRPESLSSDRIGDWDVLYHALTECERLDGMTYDIVVMLQPTAPLRRPEHVTATVEMLLDGDWDAVWTVSETDSKNHPFKQLTVAPERTLDYYDPRGGQIIARQQLGSVYHRNGIAYAFARRCLTEQKTIKGRHTGAMVLNGHFVSIDTEWDIALTEFILQHCDRQ
jgi:CMP-N,N'-diacetyllegionaminic acid synthase